jgi:NADH-quinone oxidoreductase subunit J
MLLAPLAEKISTALPPGAGAGLAFWLMASLVVLGALRVVTAKNPVHSALALILTLAAVSGLYVLLEAPFVWAVQLLVYTGGVTVLYLFVIFFSDLRALSRQRWAHKGWFWSIPGLAILLALLAHALRGAGAIAQPVDAAAATGTPARIGALLFGDLVIPFELSSVLLVVALIGAIVLAREPKAGEEAGS